MIVLALLVDSFTPFLLNFLLKSGYQVDRKNHSKKESLIDRISFTSAPKDATYELQQATKM